MSSKFISRGGFLFIEMTNKSYFDIHKVLKHFNFNLGILVGGGGGL